MTDSADNEIWKGADLRAGAAGLHGSLQGAIPALAERLGLDHRLVGRWASGTTPLPASAARADPKDHGALRPARNRLAAGRMARGRRTAQSGGSRRVYGPVHGAGPDTFLAESGWIDRRPAEETPAVLLDASTDALRENPLEQPVPGQRRAGDSSGAPFSAP